MVMAKKDIADFLEVMDHEFPEVSTQVDKLGYKVDGNQGIKVHCNLRNLKSVDYLFEHPKGFYIIEFSDLIRQHKQIEVEKETLKAANVDRALKKKLLKERGKIIHSELISKFKDTVQILNLIENHLSNIPESFHTNNRHYLIIVPPLNERDGIEYSRVLEQIKDTVKQCIPAEIYGTVNLIPLNRFLS